MEHSLLYDVIIAIMTSGGAIVGYLLVQKDTAQQKEIAELKKELENETAVLWRKHDEDVDKLQDLRVQIAGQHYVKSELDAKFERMEATFQAGFEDLGKRFDHFASIMIAQHHNGNSQGKSQ